MREKIEWINNINVNGSVLYGSMKRSKIMPSQNTKVDLQIDKLSNQQTHIGNPIIRQIIDMIL